MYARTLLYKYKWRNIYEATGKSRNHGLCGETDSPQI